MRTKIISGVIGLAALAIVLGLWYGVLRQASPALGKPAAQIDQPPERTRDGETGQTEGIEPEISFIDSPSAECYRPKANTDACFINWAYLYVGASESQYIISMTVAIDGQIRAYYGGFFQTYMYIPADMHAEGFRVACGLPGASNGNPLLGNSFAYTIRARETGGLKAANYGSVTCPSDVVPAAGLSLAGPGSGKPGVTYNFLGETNPITTSVPITYVWTATDQGAITLTGGLNSTQSYNWATDGLKTITLEAINQAGNIKTSHTIMIQSPRMYLTLVIK